ncbi:MAG: hypothetical protein R3C97_10635 [Geminicoccaceae bacterium]
MSAPPSATDNLSESERAGLARLGYLLTHACELGRRTRDGETIPLDPLLEEIEELMPVLSTFGRPAKTAAQAPLLALLEEVNAIVDYLDRECALARNEVQTASTRRRATAAYASHSFKGDGESG